MKHVLVALMMVVGLAAVGCDSNRPITADDILNDMSPELTTRENTYMESRIRHARVIDTNGRTAWDDLERWLLLDRASRLSLTPTPD